MDVATALLCDAATVREGLLHVLGGGITRLWRPALPAELATKLAVLVDLAPEDLETPHELEVLILCGELEIGRVMAGFQAHRPPRAEPGEHQLVPVVLPLGVAATPQYGKHRIMVRLDNGAAERGLEFWVLHPEEQGLPPLD